MSNDLFTDFEIQPVNDDLQNFVREVQEGIYTEDITITECRIGISDIYSLDVDDECRGEMLFLGLCY